MLPLSFLPRKIPIFAYDDNVLSYLIIIIIDIIVILGIKTGSRYKHTQTETAQSTLSNSTKEQNYEDISYIPSMEGDLLPCIDAIIEVHSEGFADLLSNIKPSQPRGPDNLGPLFKRGQL